MPGLRHYCIVNYGHKVGPSNSRRGLDRLTLLGKVELHEGSCKLIRNSMYGKLMRRFAKDVQLRLKTTTALFLGEHHVQLRSGAEIERQRPLAYNIHPIP